MTAAPGGGASTSREATGSQPCATIFFTPPRRRSIRSAPFNIIVRFLQNAVGDRVVLDRTDLTGTFSLDVDYALDERPEPAGATAPVPLEQNAPSLLTAIQEQLGLKLDSTRGPVKVIVIDRAERPTED